MNASSSREQRRTPTECYDWPRGWSIRAWRESEFLSSTIHPRKRVYHASFKNDFWLVVFYNYLMWDSSTWLTYDLHHHYLHTIDEFGDTKTRVCERVCNCFCMSSHNLWTITSLDKNDTSRMWKSCASKFAAYLQVVINTGSWWLRTSTDCPWVAIARARILVLA